MKISDILLKDEILTSEIDMNASFNKPATLPSEISEDDILIIPNPSRIPDFSRSSQLPKAVICEEKAVLPYIIPRIIVKNSRISTAMAFYRYNKIDLNKTKLIAVTGTNGKSSTAFFIKQILTNLGLSVGLIGTGKIEIGDEVISSSYYSMTTPDPPLLYSSLRKMQDAGCDAIVMEVSSHSLAQYKIEPLTFDFALFTNLSPEHLDYHKDINNYFMTKMKLFSKSNLSIFNVDDHHVNQACHMCEGNKISAGINGSGDYNATNIRNNGFIGIDYQLNSVNKKIKVSLSVPGMYNVYNSMLAIITCINMGFGSTEIENAVSKLQPLTGRYDIIRDKITVIIDYAHTPYAYKTILNEIAYIKENAKLSVVFGCGGNRDRLKRPEIAKIVEKYADTIIVTSDNSRDEDFNRIIDDIKEGFSTDKYLIIKDRSEAINQAILCANDGDIVAIIGKGAEAYNIDQDGYHIFNEHVIVDTALKSRNKCE